MSIYTKVNIAEILVNIESLKLFKTLYDIILRDAVKYFNNISFNDQCKLMLEYLCSENDIALALYIYNHQNKNTYHEELSSCAESVKYYTCYFCNRNKYIAYTHLYSEHHKYNIIEYFKNLKYSTFVNNSDLKYCAICKRIFKCKLRHDESYGHLMCLRYFIVYGLSSDITYENLSKILDKII